MPAKSPSSNHGNFCFFLIFLFPVCQLPGISEQLAPQTLPDVSLLLRDCIVLRDKAYPRGLYAGSAVYDWPVWQGQDLWGFSHIRPNSAINRLLIHFSLFIVSHHQLRYILSTNHTSIFLVLFCFLHFSIALPLDSEHQSKPHSLFFFLMFSIKNHSGQLSKVTTRKLCFINAQIEVSPQPQT